MTPGAFPTSPDPDDHPPALPPMSHQEASWHTHLAGTRAGVSPENAADPARSLAAASAPATSHGITFPPLTAGALLAIQGASRLSMEAGRPIEGAEEVAVLVYCLAEPENAFALTEAAKLSELIREARMLLAPVPLAEIPALSDFVRQAIASATGQAGQKKTDA